jgi:hypothetical protein
MNVTRIAAAGSVAAPTPTFGPSASKASTTSKKVDPAAIVSLRSRHAKGFMAAQGGHTVQAAQPTQVSTGGLERIRSLLKHGFENMKGGHKVQQITYEPTVSTTELVSKIETIAENVMEMAGGSKVQHEVRDPRLADDFVREARHLSKEVSKELQQTNAKLPTLQARGLDRNAVARLMT